MAGWWGPATAASANSAVAVATTAPIPGAWGAPNTRGRMGGKPRKPAALTTLPRVHLEVFPSIWFPAVGFQVHPGFRTAGRNRFVSYQYRNA